MVWLDFFDKFLLCIIFCIVYCRFLVLVKIFKVKFVVWLFDMLYVVFISKYGMYWVVRVIYCNVDMYGVYYYRLVEYC